MRSDFDGYEVIVVDDGSTDEATLSVIEELKSQYSKRQNVTFLRQENQGLAWARNNGIRAARGEYILPLDADNRIRPNYLSKAVAVLDNNPAVGVVYAYAKYIGEKDGIWEFPAFDARKLLLGNFVEACSVLRKSVWEGCNGYDPDMGIMGYEDWDMWIGAMEHGWKFHLVKEVLFDYRVVKGSMITGCSIPENRRHLIKYICSKHRDTYIKNLGYVVAEKDVSLLELGIHVSNLERHAGNLEIALSHRDTHIGNLEAVVQNRDGRISDLERHAGNLEEVLRHRDGRISDLETHAGNLEEVMQHRDGRISDMERHTGNLEAVLRHRDARVSDLEAHSRNLEAALQYRDIHIGNLEAHTRNLEAHGRNLEEVLRHKDRHLGNLEEELLQKETSIIALKVAVQHKEAYIGDLQESLHQRIAHIGQLEAHAGNQDEALRHRDAHIGNLEGHIAELEAQLRQRDETLGAIYTSNGWRLLSIYYRLRDRLLPANSVRRKVIKYLWNLPRRKHDRAERLVTADKVKRGVFYLRTYGFKTFLEKVKENMRAGKTDHPSGLNPPSLRLPVITEDNITVFDNVVISVIIPTKNAGEEFERLMSVLSRQKGFKNIEIVVVDSGSDDETLEIARSYGAKVIEIPPEKFSHSYARNLGADNATGGCLFFTVQDALPPSDLFLYKLYVTMRDNGLSAISCSEFPREDSDLFYNVLLWGHYRFLGIDTGDKLLSMPDKDDYILLRRNGQLSDIACLVPKKIFLKYKYRNDYAEDLDFGIRLIRDGARLALLSSVKIIHSHNRPPLYFLKRAYVDNIVMSNIFPDYGVPCHAEENLFCDIIQTYYVVHAFADELLCAADLPAETGEVFDYIDARLRSFERPAFSSALSFLGKSCSDVKLSVFLEKIANIELRQQSDDNSSESVLVPAILNTLNMVREYMTDVYPAVDEYLKKEVVSCIIKSYALQCGAHLAYSYLKGGIHVKELHDELRGGI